MTNNAKQRFIPYGRTKKANSMQCYMMHSGNSLQISFAQDVLKRYILIITLWIVCWATTFILLTFHFHKKWTPLLAVKMKRGIYIYSLISSHHGRFFLLFLFWSTSFVQEVNRIPIHLIVICQNRTNLSIFSLLHKKFDDLIQLYYAFSTVVKFVSIW